jgi:hypothetical protein
MKMDLTNKIFLSVISLSVLVVLCMAAYKFFWLGNYNFIVEAECDPSSKNCFYRDCSLEECPPNGIESYSMFKVSAADFSMCTDDSCLSECVAGTVSCQEISCDETSGDICLNGTINVKVQGQPEDSEIQAVEEDVSENQEIILE